MFKRTLLDKVKEQVICRFRGHRYGSPCFDNFSLSFCLCCHREVADRTFDDILPAPYDEEGFEWLREDLS